MTEPIGVVTMKEDGKIILQLRAEGPNGIVGDAQFEYRPEDEEYENILKHLGGLKIGETKSVPPWPDKNSYEK